MKNFQDTIMRHFDESFWNYVKGKYFQNLNVLSQLVVKCDKNMTELPMVLKKVFYAMGVIKYYIYLF